MEQTQPGLPRPYYTGHARTEFLVAEAARSIAEVSFSTEPDPNPTRRTIRQLPGLALPPIGSPVQQRRMSLTSANGPPGFTPPQNVGSPISSPPASYRGLPQVEAGSFSISQFMSSDQPLQLTLNSEVNEFGSFSSPPSNQPSSFSAGERDKVASPRGGRFATFPVKALGPRPQPGPNPTNPYITAPPMRDGDRAPSLEINRANDDFSASVVQALDGYSLAGPSSGDGPSHLQQPDRDVKRASAEFGPQRYSPPPPVYTPSNGQGLPAGAAPSQPPGAMQNGLGVLDTGKGKGPEQDEEEDEEEEGLAYMSPSRLIGSQESLPETGDRRVRFGGVNDVEAELERRHEQQEQAATVVPPPAAPVTSTTHGPPTRVPVPRFDEDELGAQQNGRLSPEGGHDFPYGMDCALTIS